MTRVTEKKAQFDWKRLKKQMWRLLSATLAVQCDCSCGAYFRTLAKFFEFDSLEQKVNQAQGI